jgi:hypothetical protein
MENELAEWQVLSKDFTLEEFTISQSAERLGYDNTPDEFECFNLCELCNEVLQPLRDLVRLPVIISSGYRSLEANAAVGGSHNSQHMEGQAADFTIPGMSLEKVFNTIFKNLPYDQLIFEFGKWIHVSYNFYEANRKQAMISTRVSGKTVYEVVEKELKEA